MTQPPGLSANLRAALLQRLSRSGAAAPATGGGTSLSGLPGARDIGMVRDAAAMLGIGNPFFRAHDGAGGAHSSIGGTPCRNFASYDYLDLNTDQRVIAAAKAAMDQYGISASASRLVAGERPVHAALEAALAAHYGTEDCLCLVSGHATNVTVIGHLLGPRDVILHDALAHNSCLEGARLSGARRISFPHNDWQAADRELAQHRARHGRALLVLEGHYSMDGDVPPLQHFITLARRHDALLMVDEAHALGVVGATGRGSFEHCGVDPAGVDIWMGTLSKSLAACGGFIAASRAVVDVLRHAAPGFVYSVGMAPLLAAAARTSLDILHAEPERVRHLQRNALRFRDKAQAAGFDTGLSAGLGIVPILLGSSIRAGRMAEQLLARGINAPPIMFPAVPERAARLRFFLSSAHDDADITAAIDALLAAHEAVATA